MSHLHETAQGTPQHHTVSSETNAFQSADQETRPAATILAWQDHWQCATTRTIRAQLSKFWDWRSCNNRWMRRHL